MNTMLKSLCFGIGFLGVLYAQTTETVIGSTTYPKQTNASMPRTLLLHPDTTVSAVWDYSAGSWNTWADLGTGYNFFNGSNWLPVPVSRIEDSRTLNGGIVVTGMGKEITIGADNNYSTSHFASRNTTGSGPWTDAVTLLPGISYVPQGVMMSVGGTNKDRVHVIELVPYAYGQEAAILYSRSADGGNTFTVQRSLLSAFDSTRSFGYRENNYAIDAYNTTVAIVAGGMGEDIVLNKSTDNGNTWNATVIQDFPIPLFNYMMDTDSNGDMVPETLATNDGAFSLLIDDAGTVHIWWGAASIYSDNSDFTVEEDFVQNSHGLYYWKEGMGSPVLLADVADLNGNSAIDVTGWGTYYLSLTSQPSSGIDADGNIFLGYSGIVENTDDGTGKSYRNIFMMGSTDHGNTWTAPYAVNPSNTDEKCYPSLAREIKGNLVRMTYETDTYPGHGVGTLNPDVDNAGSVHNIIYTEVPTTEIGIISTASVENMSISILKAYPNPAAEFVSLTGYAENAEQVKLYSVSGNLLYAMPITQKESTTINVSGLAEGIYFVQIVGQGVHTVKVIVQ